VLENGAWQLFGLYRSVVLYMWTGEQDRQVAIAPLCRPPMEPAVRASDVVVSFGEADWLQSLISRRRPNLMVLAEGRTMEGVVARLTNLCPQPVHPCRVPGELWLPRESGAVLLWDVAQLTRGQQIRLYDWIGGQGVDRQLISVTSAPLLPLVDDGRFLEGLLYRMNVVSFSVAQDRTENAGTCAGG
jgi:hypothetical protein